MYFEGEIPTVSYGSNCGNQGGFGNGWEGLIGLALVASLFGGWGNGFGFGGFGGGRGGYDFPCGTPATQADLANGFAQNTLQRGIDDIILGQAQMQNFINQGFAGLNQTVTNGFAGVNNAVCTLGYQQAQLVNGLSRELGDCCCATQRAIDGVKFENCQNTAAIIGAINAGNQRLVDIYTADKIEALRAENTALKGRISDDYQADRIISRLSPCPSPAYIVPNPNCCYTYGVSGVGYAQSGCGCGC